MASIMPYHASVHKVQALKIASITNNEDGSALLTPEDTKFPPFTVGFDWMKINQPNAIGAGYFVYFEPRNNYTYQSVAEFEENWSPVDEVS